jgi:hypothetical protein
MKTSRNLKMPELLYLSKMSDPFAITVFLAKPNSKSRSRRPRGLPGVNDSTINARLAICQDVLVEKKSRPHRLDRAAVLAAHTCEPVVRERRVVPAVHHKNVRGRIFEGAVTEYHIRRRRLGGVAENNWLREVAKRPVVQDDPRKDCGFD